MIVSDMPVVVVIRQRWMIGKGGGYAFIRVRQTPAIFKVSPWWRALCDRPAFVQDAFNAQAPAFRHGARSLRHDWRRVMITSRRTHAYRFQKLMSWRMKSEAVRDELLLSTAPYRQRIVTIAQRAI
jgi:hypothetical protein